MSVVRVERYHKWEKSWDSNIAGKTLQSNWQTSGAEITYIYSKHYTYFSHEFPILWKDGRLPRVLNFGGGASGLRCWRTAIMSAGATSEPELRAHRRIHPTIHMLSILIKYLRSNSNSVQDQFNIVKKEGDKQNWSRKSTGTFRRFSADQTPKSCRRFCSPWHIVTVICCCLGSSQSK